MSIFNEGMNLSYSSAMDQMSEVVTLNGGHDVSVICDPVEFSSRRVPGGKMTESDAIIYILKTDYDNYNIKKGDKITKDSIPLRVESIDNDGTDLIALHCGPPLKATIPLR